MSSLCPYALPNIFSTEVKKILHKSDVAHLPKIHQQIKNKIEVFNKVQRLSSFESQLPESSPFVNLKEHQVYSCPWAYQLLRPLLEGGGLLVLIESFHSNVCSNGDLLKVSPNYSSPSSALSHFNAALISLRDFYPQNI